MWRGRLSNRVELNIGGAGCLIGWSSAVVGLVVSQPALWKMRLLINGVELNKGGAGCLMRWN